jgi:hypothetical protein
MNSYHGDRPSIEILTTGVFSCVKKIVSEAHIEGQIAFS